MWSVLLRGAKEKSRQELESIFKTTFSTPWEPRVDVPYTAQCDYPVISNQRPVSLQAMTWGFPLYLDDQQTMLKSITQVGVEWVLEKPMFASIRDKRCLVPLELDGQLKYAAGTWDVFMNKAGLALSHFSVLTVRSGAQAHQSPFILEGAMYKKWLSPGALSEQELAHLLKGPKESAD